MTRNSQSECFISELDNYTIYSKNMFMTLSPVFNHVELVFRIRTGVLFVSVLRRGADGSPDKQDLRSGTNTI